MQQLRPFLAALLAAAATAFFLHTPAQAGPTTKQNRWWTISGTGVAALGDINAQIPIPRPTCESGTEPLIVDVKVSPIQGNGTPPDNAARWQATVPLLQRTSSSAVAIYQPIAGAGAAVSSFSLPAGQPPASDFVFITVTQSNANPAVFDFAAHVTFACGVASVIP